MLNQIFLIIALLYYHPVHLTVTNIEYFQNEKNIIISIRLFTNDFEKILDIKNNITLNIGKKMKIQTQTPTLPITLRTILN